MNDERPRRPPTAQEFVLGELRRGIANGELRAGEQIRQDALAERLGTSRVPLREALKILEGEGQVAYHPHRGYFVAELSSADLQEVYRIRRLLEDEAVTIALPLLANEQLEAMQRAVISIEDAEDAGDIPAMTQANRNFHFLLVDSAGMPRLSRLIRQLWDATDAYRSLYFAAPENREHVRHEHRQILAAVASRDLAASLELLRQHREQAVDRLQRVLDSNNSASDQEPA